MYHAAAQASVSAMFLLHHPMQTLGLFMLIFQLLGRQQDGKEKSQASNFLLSK